MNAATILPSPITAILGDVDVSKPIKLDDVAMLRLLACKACLCGNPKGRSMSHCRSCYYTLSPSERSALYNRIGQGYEEAFMASLKVLKEAKHLNFTFEYEDPQ